MENKIHDILETQTQNIQELPVSFIYYTGFMRAPYSYDWYYPLFITKMFCLHPKTTTTALTLNCIHYKDFMPTTYNYDSFSNIYELHLTHNV